jgi:hypothetical protein
VGDVEALGRRHCKKASGYHQQARVETPSSATSPSWGLAFERVAEAAARSRRALCCVLNHMTELGRPESSAIRR